MGSAPLLIQYRRTGATAWTGGGRAFYSARMRELRDVKKLDDRFGQFLVRVKCPACGASRDIAAEALARLVGWSVTSRAWRRDCAARSAAPRAPRR